MEDGRLARQTANRNRNFAKPFNSRSCNANRIPQIIHCAQNETFAHLTPGKLLKMVDSYQGIASAMP